MSSLANSLFTSYKLSEEELVEGQKLTRANVEVFQTLLCSLAEEKISLFYDVKNHQGFVQREAELQGQISLLRTLLADAEKPSTSFVSYT